VHRHWAGATDKGLRNKLFCCAGATRTEESGRLGFSFRIGDFPWGESLREENKLSSGKTGGNEDHANNARKEDAKTGSVALPKDTLKGKRNRLGRGLRKKRG